MIEVESVKDIPVQRGSVEVIANLLGADALGKIENQPAGVARAQRCETREHGALNRECGGKVGAIHLLNLSDRTLDYSCFAWHGRHTAREEVRCGSGVDPQV